MNTSIIQEFLDNLYIFKYLNLCEKKNITENLIEVQFQPNERIFTRFDEPYAFFIVKSGTVKLGFPER